ncbi:MAG: transposase [Candidatus Omnitrophica bacterium]|nr:transposase [Candidatus Omnitrophota bacterium]
MSIRSEKITSYLGHFLNVLTKPQRKYFLIYLIGLIYLEKFRSIREIAGHFGRHNTDGLHHFLKYTPQKALQLEEQNRCQIAPRISQEEALMILDDTTCPRNGQHIEGIGFHYSIYGLVRGLSAVTAIIKSGSQCYAWAIRGYRPKQSSLAGTFKSKVHLAQEILLESFHLFPRGLTVFMDVWYACAPVLNPIQEAGWHFLAAIKSNRILFLNGKKVSASYLAKEPRRYKSVRVGKKRRFQVAKIKADLPLVGPALVFITKSPADGVRFFLTNNFDMTESEMVKLYAQRFAIEIFHKDIKQHLGFTEMFMRSWNGIQTHWRLLGIAYNTIAAWNGSTPRSLRKKIRHFRNSLSCRQIMNLLKLKRAFQ